MRDSYIFYASFYEAIKELDDANRLLIYDAINEYSLTGQLPHLEGITKAIMTLIMPQIDANRRRYENGCKGANYGKQGGRPKNENPKDTPNKPLNNPKETPNDNVNVNDNVNDNVNYNNSPLSPKGGNRESEKNWRESYDVYIAELKQAYTQAVNDPEWMVQREKFHPNLNIKRSLNKAYTDFWGTEAGWMHKKNEYKKPREPPQINWRLTLTNALTQKMNQVYKQKYEE